MRPSTVRALTSVAAVATALVICFAVVALMRGSLSTAAQAFGALAAGAFGDFPRFVDTGDWGGLLRPWGESTSKGSLLLLTGLSVAVAFRVGLFNIGAQGQMMVGAFAAAVAGSRLSLPSVLHVPALWVCAGLAGAGFALVPALLKTRRGVHEVISTIMFNWLAVALVENWLVVGPFKARAEGDHSMSGTDEIAQTAQLPRLLGDVSRLHLGFVAALCCMVALWFYFTRFHAGFAWRAVGASQSVAHASGIDVARVQRNAMLLSGALAGLAGAVLVMGTEYKYPATLGAPYGFDGIAMALLGQGHPFGVGASALFFGALRAGGTRMQLFGVHKSFPELIQGLALLLVAANYAWERLFSKWRRL